MRRIHSNCRTMAIAQPALPMIGRQQWLRRRLQRFLVRTLGSELLLLYRNES
jgi:hypothetical protein